MSKSKAYNEFESFLNECNIYVWEWYLPERFVRFGIPSLDGLWVNEQEKIFKLTTVLERVHPDDVDKVFVRKTSPIYKSDNMFEVDLRLNLSGKYEWYGFRGKTLKRDKTGRPTYVRGVAINIDQRIRAQRKLLTRKDRHLQEEKQKTSYFSSIMQEVLGFIRNLAANADSLIMGTDNGSKEERLGHLNEIKEQGARIAGLMEKMKTMLGEKEQMVENAVKRISLWEHLAELQQVFSLKLSGSLKLYFSNMYDDSQIDIDINIFDLLLENVINAQVHNARHGSLIMSYAFRNSESLVISITCSENESKVPDFEQTLSETGLGLSVCRILAQRLYGTIEVVTDNAGRIQYQIILPVSQAETQEEVLTKLSVFDEVDEDEDDADDENSPGYTLPHVLVGIHNDSELIQDQHLFKVTTAHTLEAVKKKFDDLDPDIVFIDSKLRGGMSIFDLIAYIRRQAHDTPIIVTADVALRPLHKQVRQLGAQYLLTNPLSVRKINIMIKKYLK